MKQKSLQKIFKKIWITILFSIFITILIPNNIHAQGDLEVDWFNILPELSDSATDDVNSAIYIIWYEWGHVRENYNDAADKIETSEQIASWIMNRNTIMNYLVFVVKFLGQLWLVVWFWFITYAWYKYMLSVFEWGKTPTSTLKNAIIWVIIVIFSYAIMKTLTSIIGIS